MKSGWCVGCKLDCGDGDRCPTRIINRIVAIIPIECHELPLTDLDLLDMFRELDDPEPAQ